MPTFESISFSAELASRLVSIDKDATNSVCRVGTPYVLLSRNAESLRLQKEDGSLSTDPIHCNGFPELRQQVATKLLSLTQAGKRQGRMQSLLLQNQQQEQEQEPQQDKIAAHKIHGCVSVMDMLKYQTITTPSIVLSTGSTSLDRLLSLPPELSSSLASAMNSGCTTHTIPQGNKLPWGHVIQCSGAAASGKTQVALQVALSAASANLPVIYLTSALGQGSLRPLAVRLRQLASASLATKVVMDRVSFPTPLRTDGYQLLRFLAELEDSLLTNNDTTAPRVLILDAASGCLTAEDEALLHRVVMRLKTLARHYNLLVWINNSSSTTTTAQPNTKQQRHSIDGMLEVPPTMGVADDDEEEVDSTPAPTSTASSNNNKPKVALGGIWKQVWDIHVYFQQIMEKTGQQGAMLRVRATLEGHPSKNCDDNKVATAEFRITSKGVQDVLETGAEEEEED